MSIDVSHFEEGLERDAAPEDCDLIGDEELEELLYEAKDNLLDEQKGVDGIGLFLREIGRVPLLEHEEERALLEQIQTVRAPLLKNEHIQEWIQYSRAEGFQHKFLALILENEKGRFTDDEIEAARELQSLYNEMARHNLRLVVFNCQKIRV